jgi:hypothetical protein
MSRLFNTQRYDKSLFLIIIGIVGVIIQVMDRSFGNTYIIPQYEMLFFSMMILISLAIQYLLIKRIRDAVKIERSKSRVGRAVLIASTILQFSSSGALVVILFQALFTLKYSIVLPEIVVGVNLITSSGVLAILSSRFVRSYKYSPSKLVLAYTIAIAALSLSGIITFAYIDNFLRIAPPGEYITSEFNQWSSYSPRVPAYLTTSYQIIGIISFVTLWIATVFMTRHYASNSKKIKYWIIASAPLVYFLGQFLVSLLENLDWPNWLGVADTPMYIYLYNFLINTARTGGGLMFGFAFFIISKTITHIQLKNSIVMAGVGLILLFGANATSLLIMTPYPPWGVLSASFLIVGSYSLIIGLDSAGLYLATDSSLRRIIQKSPQINYDILKSLGHTRVQEIVAEKIQNISKQVYNEIEFDNLFSTSFEPANVREYIDEVLRETSKRDTGLVQKSKGRAAGEDLK